jgi:hypothetical protein
MPPHPGRFKHDTRPITFCLVVDDFGVKYIGRHNAEHLISTLSKKYTITTDWTGAKYLGLHLAWDYNAKHVDISMPQYVARALLRFDHPDPKTPQHSPHTAKPIIYGPQSPIVSDSDDSPRISPSRVTRLQQIVGTFLYYARAVDSSMLVALGSLASAQTRATENTELTVTHFLDYAATHPLATVRFHASPMTLAIHSDASYLSEPEARSRISGIFYLSTPKTPDNPLPPLNGAIHIISSILQKRITSVAEAEIAALFYNAGEACPLRVALEFMGHPQPATPLQTDNSTANSVLNNTIKQKRTRIVDMNFYWLRDKVADKVFDVHWQPGSENCADYFSNHHPPKTHQTLRHTYYTQDTPVSVI